MPGAEGLAAREAALRILLAIDRDDAFTNLALDAGLERSGLSGPDRALATELVYGVTRMRATLDWWLEHFTRRPLERAPEPIKNILRLGAYQIAYLDRVPAPAAVDSAVELAKRHGHAGAVRFVNAVLRAFVRGRAGVAWPDPGREPDAFLARTTSHPLWLCRRWILRLGFDEARELCEANLRPAPVVLRANPLRADSRRLLERLRADGIDARSGALGPDAVVLEGAGSPGRLQAFRDGWATVQDEAAQLVAPACVAGAPLGAGPVVDACSAPGSKTTHLAALLAGLAPEQPVVACDIHPAKLRLVVAAGRRLGAGDRIRAVAADARRLGAMLGPVAASVLVDAPCSGFGVLRRRPDIKWKRTPADLGALAALQADILDGAAGAVRPGGVLVYSTCTTEPEENEAVVGRFLARHPEFRPDDLRPALPAALRAEPGAAEGRLQLWPHRHGTDGVFIARMVREE